MFIVRKLFFIALLLAVASQAHAASYQKGVDDTKPSTCTNAIEREDGSALPASQIDRVELVVSQGGTPVHTIIHMGGCKAGVTMDLTALPVGTYDQTGITYDTGGLNSKPSANVPFDLTNANPGAPTITE